MQPMHNSQISNKMWFIPFLASSCQSNFFSKLYGQHTIKIYKYIQIYKWNDVTKYFSKFMVTLYNKFERLFKILYIKESLYCIWLAWHVMVIPL